MSRPTEVAGDQLRAIVERIEHIDAEIKELNEGKKEIFLEAKGNGFDVKILREVIRVRKQDQEERDELDSLLDVYLQAIEGQGRVTKRRVLVDANQRPPLHVASMLELRCRHLGATAARNLDLIRGIAHRAFRQRTNDLGGDTRHQAVRRNILGDNRSGRDH
jgi:uncharacterized protein (UPF0335 family)